MSDISSTSKVVSSSIENPLPSEESLIHQATGETEGTAFFNQALKTDADSNSEALPEDNAVNGSTRFKSMRDLQKKAPQVYNEWVKGIGLQMMQKSVKDQRKLAEAMRKMREEENR